MASIKKRGDDGKWRARYRDPAGKEHARHFDRKVDAQQWLDEVTTTIVSGVYVDPKAGKTTVREYAKEWEALQSGDATERVVDNALRLHLLPRIGDLPIGTVRRSHMQAVVKALTDAKLAPTTIGSIYGVACRLFASAVDDKVIASTPCRKITLPRPTSGEVVPPTVEQVTLMAEKVGERHRAAVVMLAGSGLRIGELLGLRVSDVDFLRRTVRVERQQTQAGRITPPKSATSVRTVPLGQLVIDVLAAHLARFGPAREHDQRLDENWLFTEPDGSPISYRRWRSIWESARDAAKLPDLDTHGMRHFFASALIAGGASVKQVQTTLGHSSAVVTLQTYSHMWPGDDDRTRKVLDSTLGILRTTCGLPPVEDDETAGQEASGPDGAFSKQMKASAKEASAKSGV